MTASAQILMLMMILCAVGVAGAFIHRRHFFRRMISLQTVFIAAVIVLGADKAPSALFVACLGVVYTVAGLAVFMLYLKKHGTAEVVDDSVFSERKK